MNPSSLIALTTLNTAGWLAGSDGDSTKTSAKQAHRELLKTTHRWASPKSGVSLRPAAMREALLTVINRCSRTCIDQVGAALENARLSGASYLDESLDWEGRADRQRHLFTALPPFIEDIGVAFKWLPKLRDLSDQQQLSVVRSLEIDYDRDTQALLLQFAREDGEPNIAFKAAALKRVEQQASRASGVLNADASRLKADFKKHAPLHHADGFLTVLEVPLRASAATMRRLAEGLEHTASWLVQPLPLHPCNTQKKRQAAASAWSAFEDCGALLRVLAVWLRALAHGAPVKTCPLCYRHRDVLAKRFCKEHRRASKHRLEAKQYHAARLFHLELEEALVKDSKLRSLVSGAHFSGIDDAQMRAEAVAYPLPGELVGPAAVLATALRELRPALTPDLNTQISKHFVNLLDTASLVFNDEHITDQSKRIQRLAHRSLARPWLGWDTFVKSWFSDTLSAPWLDTPKRGRAFDVNHPSANGYAVSPTTVAMDLLRQRVWTHAMNRLEQEGYLSLHRVMKLRWPGVTRNKSKTGATLKRIAEQLDVSTEAVRQTALYGTDEKSGPRRDRILPAGKRRLFGET